ncbi:FtsZ family, C-terminal domain [Lachnospiraceae bacterium]|nr:FtsZ family, C-terminal domain [Lachnospiraceae bacterium]
MLEISDKPFFVDEAFQVADNVLRWAISGITNIIFNKGLINLDFNDLCTILKDKGNAHIGIGVVKEGASLLDGVKQAIDSPLLDYSIKGAGTIMLNTSGRVNLAELNEAVSYIKSIVGKESNIIWGTVTDPKQIEDNSVVITLIATGIDANETAGNDVNEKDVAKNPVSFNGINKFPGEMIIPPKMPINNSASFLRRDYDIKGKLEIPNFLKNHSS